jgi:plasmid maintenance system antidote protein VapI
VGESGWGVLNHKGIIVEKSLDYNSISCVLFSHMQLRRHTMIGETVRRLLEMRGMTQADLARKSGLSTGHVTQILKGDRGKALSIRTASKLGDALGVKLDFFYQEDTHKQVNNSIKG